MSVATERERMTWADLGTGSRDLAEQVVASGYEPGLILGIARGGLLISGGLSYALDVKNAFTMNVEFYTGVDERLPVPMLLPPSPTSSTCTTSACSSPTTSPTRDRR